MTDILLVSYFRKEFTIKTIEYLFERTRSPFRLIVVDNGSTDGTREWLFENVRSPHLVVLLSENLGLEQAKNVGLSLVRTPRFADTDNDILVPDLDPDWLAAQHGLMDRHPEFAAISLRPQVLVGVGTIFKDKDEVVENNVAGGSMRLMDTGLVRKVGGWRSEYTNRSEEWHISGRLKGEGRKVGYARDLFCYHLFGENERWGYAEGIDHSHTKDRVAIRDSHFEVDPKTLSPKSRCNE